MQRVLAPALALLLACVSSPKPAPATTEQNAPTPPQNEPAPYQATIASDKVDGDVREVVLSNGLRVLLKEDRAAPVATLVVYYRAGSRNEVTGITGSAHLLEHLLFKGSKQFPGREAIWGGLSRVGASFNATTYYDRTNYFETLPIEHLPFAIALEADRMRNATFTDADRQSEMTVVRNELERGENNPGRVLGQAVWAQSIVSHPYHHPVIGWRSDVENMPTTELRAFYERFYRPDNAVVVVVGDINKDDVLKLIVEQFGKHPGGNTFPEIYTTEEKQRGERRVVIRKPGELGIVELGWKLPAAKSPDVVPLKVLQLILAGTLEINEMGDPLAPGISNRLYRALVETQLSTGVSMDYTLMIDPSVGTISARVRPGVTHEAVEKAIRAEIEKLRTTPVTPEELKRAKNRARAAFGLSQDGTYGQAMALGYFGLVSNWRFVREFADRVDKVTAEDVKRVANEFFSDDATTVGWFVPIPAGEQKTTSLHDELRPHGRATLRDVDDAAEAREVTERALAGGGSDAASRIRKKTLSNGMRVVVLENKSTPTFALSGNVDAGSSFETRETLGIAGITAEMLSRGTKKRDKFAIAAQLEEVGAGLGIGGGFEAASLSAFALREDLDRVLDVLSEQILEPSFPADELEKVKTQRIARLKQDEDSTAVKGRRALYQALYPPGHPFYWENLDTSVAAVSKVKVDDVKRWWSTQWGPDRTVIAIVGNVDADAVFAGLERRFGTWKPVGKRAVEAPIPPLGEAKRIDVFMPDKSNVDLFLAHRGDVLRTDEDYYATMLANHVLGSGVSGRLFRRVRNELGLTYGIGSGLSTGRIAGPWSISLTVNPNAIAPSLEAVQQVLAGWEKDGATEEELADAKTSITGLYKVGLATNGGLASVLAQYESLGLGAEFITEHPKRVQAVTREQVNAAIKKHFFPGKLTTVASGTLPR